MLTEGESQSTEGIMKKALFAIKHMSNNKSPGTDGFTTEFFKFFWSNLGHVIVQGDFNAYANTKKDFVCYDDSGKSNPEDDHYISDQNLPRNNLDPKVINNSGKHLLNLCKE